jgi:release factor glutamine methyltransferase
MSITIKDFVANNLAKLKDVTNIPKKEIELFIAHLLDISHMQVQIYNDKELTTDQVSTLQAQIDKRATSYPFEYITGIASFYSEEFFVEQGVLIPRPETELLIDEVLKLLDEVKKDTIKIVEIGVGSGIISVMLAKLIPNAQILSLDINEKALALAKKNAIKHGVEDRIEFRYSDLLSAVDQDFDICVSNPPYIADDCVLPKNVEYEPSNALFGGSVGDELLKDIITQTNEKNIKFLACEMGYDQKEPLTKFVKDNFVNIHLEFYKDYCDFDRGFVLKF